MKLGDEVFDEYFEAYLDAYDEVSGWRGPRMPVRCIELRCFGLWTEWTVLREACMPCASHWGYVVWG